MAEPPSYEAEFGNLVHTVIAYCLQNADIKPETISQQLVLANPLLVESDAEEAVKLSKRFLKGYCPEGDIYIEQELSAVLRSSHHSHHQHQLKGYADLIEVVNGEIAITDFKTGRSPYKVLDNKQLSLYAWMAAQQFGAVSVTGRLIWLRSTSKERFQEEIIAENIQQEAEAWAVDIINQIEAAAKLPGWAGFPERPGSWCSYCPHTANCLTLPIPNNNPEEIGMWILRLEALVADLKEKLKTHVEIDGPLTVADEVFDFHPRSSWDWDIRGLAALLDQMGLDPYNYLSADGRKLKKFLDGTYGNLFRQVGKEKISKYFTHKKAVINDDTDGHSMQEAVS
ncbi:MAG: PD-(D/E)XK nuclease family protein [Chloroflexi bacterium]|nr:PD-(D/E)XK nuclease family protein [Chloroflexota bacterium]